jgi:hypothetical protein
MRLAVQITSTKTLKPGEPVTVAHEEPGLMEAPKCLTIRGKKKLILTTPTVTLRGIFKHAKPETEIEITGWESTQNETKKPVTVVLS